MPTTSRGYRYPGSPDSEPPNGPLQIGNLAADIDADVSRLAAGSNGFLGAVNKTTSASGTVTGTTAVTVHSITVTVPAGLEAGKRLKVTGFVICTTASGVGATVQIQGGDARSTAGSFDGDLHAFPRYDASVAAGSRTYNLQVRSTVAAQDVNWRYPHLSVEIV